MCPLSTRSAGLDHVPHSQSHADVTGGCNVSVGPGFGDFVVVPGAATLRQKSSMAVDANPLGLGCRLRMETSRAVSLKNLIRNYSGNRTVLRVE